MVEAMERRHQTATNAKNAPIAKTAIKNRETKGALGFVRVG
jgi:hypothetical protein